MPRTLSNEVEINGLQPSKPCYIKLQAFNDYGASQTSVVPIAYYTQGLNILFILTLSLRYNTYFHPPCC